MSVLIKGMKMPKHCADKCPLMENGRCWGVKNQPESVVIAGHRPSWCPLIELPVPHGKLIDADALDDVVFNLIESGCYITRNDYKQLSSMIFEWPTVIEAEE